MLSQPVFSFHPQPVRTMAFVIKATKWNYQDCFAMWRYQHVLRDLIEAHQKVSIFALQTRTVSFEAIKKTDINQINNKEILYTSNNRGHSFMTSIVENSDHFPLSNSIQFSSDASLFCNKMDFHSWSPKDPSFQEATLQNCPYNQIGALTSFLLLKIPRRKLEPWFVLWSFILPRLLCISINLSYAHERIGMVSIYASCLSWCP